MDINTSRQAGQKGFTLIEALVVMIVGIVILAAAAAGIGKLFRSSEIATEAENITQMAAGLRNLKNGVIGYSGLDTETAVKFKAVPVDMPFKYGLVFNSWNGAVIINSENNGQSFAIQYNEVPPEACQQLALKLRNAGWSRVEAGTDVVRPDTSLEDIGNACKLDHNLMRFVSSS